MKAIYFPFTCLPESIAMPLSRLLGRIMIIQPIEKNCPETLRRLEKDGCIEIHVPFSDDEERLIACSKEFQQWGQIHRGDEASLKDIFKNGFSSQAFTAQIRTDILKGQADAEFETDPVFLSRLFLLMAQNFDMQQSEVDQKLALSMNEEQALFRTMTGEEKRLSPSSTKHYLNDTGSYMTDSRMTAWFHLLQEANVESFFWVSSSRSVLDMMREKIPRMEAIGGIHGISEALPITEKDALNQQLMDLATKPWTGADAHRVLTIPHTADEKINFKLFIVPEVSPDAIANLFLKSKPASKGNKNKYLNTLIGFFEV